VPEAGVVVLDDGDDRLARLRRDSERRRDQPRAEFRAQRLLDRIDAGGRAGTGADRRQRGDRQHGGGAARAGHVSGNRRSRRMATLHAEILSASSNFRPSS